MLRLALRSVPLWVGTGFLSLGVFFVAMGLQDAQREHRYQQAGRTVDAVVLSKSIRRASRAGNSSTRYEIAYRFATDDGRMIDGVHAVGVDEWEALQPGRRVTVTYLPGAPESSRAEGTSEMASALIAVGLGSLFVLVGGVIVRVSVRQVGNEWRALREMGPAADPPPAPGPSIWVRLRGLATMLTVLFVALVVGETVPALKAMDRLAARHASVLMATTIGMTVVGFVLFMGAVLYRIFGGTEGSSFHDEFSLTEAKQAWRRRAWRTSLRWRANFLMSFGALNLTVGLFGIFAVMGPAGFKLLFAAGVVYAGTRMIVAFARA